MSYSEKPKRVRKGTGTALALVLAVSVSATGCDGLLDIEVPGEVTLIEAMQPTQARLLVNSAISDIECAFSDLIALNAAGYEDAVRRTVGWWGGQFEYLVTPSTGGTCSSGETSVAWFNPLHKGRWMAEQVYDRLENDWTVDQVPARTELMGTAAIYAGITYTLLGEHFCEVAADAGPLMSWEQSLALGEQWFSQALGHIGTSDFAIPTGVTGSARQMAHLLRARARFAQGNETGALADIAEVDQGFESFITRDGGDTRQRWNRPYASHIGLGWVALMGPIEWTGNPNPVNGASWPAVIPFTGYWDLAIGPDGRAISADQYPITLDDPGTVADTRVPAEPLTDNGVPIVGGDFGYPMWQQQKYLTADADIPLAKWEEAWLIRAQIEGAPTAIGLVNDIREAHDLPTITGAYEAELLGDEDAMRDMLIEEIRRTHFLEGRYWSTKLRNDDILWFPRGEGITPWQHTLRTGVRMVYPGSEFQQNPNLTEEDQGSLCPPFQDPTA